MVENDYANIELRVENLEKEVENNREAHKAIHDRINLVVKDAARSDKEKAVVETKLDAMRNTLNEIKNEVIALKEKPSKRWESLIVAIISAVVGIVVGHFLGVG